MPTLSQVFSAIAYQVTGKGDNPRVERSTLAHAVCSGTGVLLLNFWNFTSTILARAYLQTMDITAYSADGAITVQTSAVNLNKSSIGAYTLAAPTAAQDGVQLEIFAGTAFAHVITATGLLQDGVTGGAKNTATFGAFVGAGLTLLASGGKWIVLSKNVCTIA